MFPDLIIIPDEKSTSSAAVDASKEPPEQPIPEGFFDDPVLDAKVWLLMTINNNYYLLRNYLVKSIKAHCN